VQDFLSTPFWFALGQIILLDLVLGGDNAVVIALACRRLPAAQRMKGILWGTAGAIVLRVILIAFALALLQVPYLKLAAALLLLWIGARLIAPAHAVEHGAIQTSERLWQAVRTIIMADVVMSLENVLAIAAAAQRAGAQHQLLLAALGLLISVPIIVWSSQLVLKLMERFAFVIVLGGMLLGWIAGGMIHADPALAGWAPQGAAWHYGMAAIGALLVLFFGWLQKARLRAKA
jgi:YjbE family integral membrane protein